MPTNSIQRNKLLSEAEESGIPILRPSSGNYAPVQKTSLAGLQSLAKREPEQALDALITNDRVSCKTPESASPTGLDTNTIFTQHGCPPHGAKAIIGRRPNMEDTFTAVPFLLEVIVFSATEFNWVLGAIWTYARDVWAALFNVWIAMFLFQPAVT